MKNKISNIKNNELFQLITSLLIFFMMNSIAKQAKQKYQINKKSVQGLSQNQIQQQLINKEFQKNELSKVELDKKKGLLIFLDDSEINDFGALSIELSIALYQEASPMLVSTSLLYNLFEHRSKDNRSITALYDEFSKEQQAYYLKKKKDPEIEKALQEKMAIPISKLSFQADKWIIKKINNSLNLLLPIRYLKSINISIDKVKEYRSDNKITDIELQLGLKVNHMESIDYSLIIRPLHGRFVNYFLKSTIRYLRSMRAHYFVTSLDMIFCQKADYKEKMIIPEWHVFISGHGLINHSVVDLNFNDFKETLRFFDHKINTKLLVMLSCYAAGVNAEIIYGNIKSETQEYYSFPIIIQGLNDVVTSVATPDLISNWHNGKEVIRLYTAMNFADFFKRAKTMKNEYGAILRPISEGWTENTAQIKLPGIEWFSVVDIDNKIVSIGSILAKTRDPQKPLDVVSFFKKEPAIILLYADTIPFELKINSYNIRAIVSMVSSGITKEDAIRTVYELKDLTPKRITLKIQDWLQRKAKLMASLISVRLLPKDRVQVIHRIKKISSTVWDFYSMLSWFNLIRSSQSYKWFFIDEITDSSGITNKDVLIVGSKNSDNVTVYFKEKDNVLFKWEDKEKKTEKIMHGSDDEKYYNERIHIIRNEYPKLSEKAKQARQEITSENIKKIENVLIRRRESKKASVPKMGQAAEV